MDDLKLENTPLNVIPVTEYDPFEAKFAASLYWLVFRATEDGDFDSVPSQVTSPIQRDSEKRITVRSEVTEFLTNGEIYCKVCDGIFHGKVPVVGQWAIIQTLSRHGFYVVEEGDIAVTDSALQQRKPFRKSTHLALMDCLMSAFSSRAVSVQQVVQSVSKFSSFNASKELPFDLEDALLLWINKICAALNENQLKKQRQHAEQLLQNQDKAKRFRFRRDQLQPKVQTEFSVMEDLLKDISDGQSLLAIIMFYHPTVISLEDIRFGKNLSSEDCVHNLDLFRTLCSQFICTSVLALKVEDLLYGSQAMKPNVIALLAEVFNKCEVESQSNENGVKERPTYESDVDLRYIVANKENVMDNRSSSAPILNSDKNRVFEHGSPRETIQGKNERSSSMSGRLKSSTSDRIEQLKSSGTQGNTNSRLSFKSPFQLDFTVDDDVQQPTLNKPLLKQDVHEKDTKEKENPFSGIIQRPVLVGDRKGSLPNTGTVGSPRVTPRQEHPLLLRRNKQKQRTLDLEEWDMQQEEVEDKSILQRYLQELHLNDLQRSQSLTGLDKAKVESRQSFHAWREDTGASLSDTNLASSRNQKISLDFSPNVATSAPQRGTEESIPQRGAEGIGVQMKSSCLKAKREEHSSQDSLSSTDSLNIRDKPRSSLMSGVRDSCASDISVKELSQFEEIEAKILAGKSVETPRTFVKPKTKRCKAPVPQEDEDDLNTSVSSEDMNMFRLEVLQRLTEDKIQQIPDGAEMEDDDDPIFLARNNAASGSRNPPDQRTRLEVPDAPADDPTDQLSPITETSEPVASNPNSVSSANSTAPSSPCSPLDVAPFMPAFFTTSPASTLERKSQRLSIKNREDTEVTLIDEEEDDFPSDPVSQTPRFQEKTREKSGLFPAQSKSFEQLARGSYTVGHVSVESAKAAGIPVIAAERPVSEAGTPVQATGYPLTETGLPIRERTDSSTSASSYQESSEVFHSRKLSQKGTDSRRDLSGFRPLALSSGGVELIGYATERVDGRRDSLETSPVLSPALTRGKRDDDRQEAALRTREILAQDSPSDVVIFERSLSNPPEASSPRDAQSSQMRENANYNSETVTRSNKSEVYVFDFNQDTVQHYKNGRTASAQDFRTYKKSKQGGLAESEVPQGDRRAASFNENFANQGTQRFQQDAHSGTYNKKPNEQEHSTAGQQQTSDSLDGRPRHRIPGEARMQGVNIKDLRQSDGFSTFRKDSTSEINNGEVGPSAHALDLRRSDGFATFRKGAPDATSENMSVVSTHDHRKIEAKRFSTFAKSAKKQSDEHNYAEEGFHHFQRSNTEPTDIQQATMAARTPYNDGAEGERQATPRGREEKQIRVSGSSNIARSRTFRKTPDGQIIDDRSFRRSISSGHERDHSATSSDSKLSGQQTVVTNIRVSPEGAGSDNPHRISWTDESEAGVRLTRQLNASVDRSTTQERSPTSSPRRQRSPRQTGRGSPGARISWLTAAKSGVGGQVILNDKDCMQEDTETKHFLAKSSGHERPQFIAPAVFHPTSLRQNEASVWKQNAPDRMITERQSPAVRFGLLNSNTSAYTFSAADHGPNTRSDEASFTTSEPDTRAGGSIRDRIAALSAAAGVSRLNVTPVREQSHVDVTTGREQPKEAAEKGVAFDVEFQKASKPRPPPRLTSRFRTKDLERKDEPACETRGINQRERGVENNGELGAVNNRELGAVTNTEFGAANSRGLGTVNNRELRVEKNKGFGSVNNKELGAVGDKSVAFEVCFDDEPRSKRCREDVGLMQSPFKVFKTHSNRRHQQKSCVKIQLQRTNADEGSLICAQKDDWKDNSSISSFCSDAVLVRKETSNNLSVDITTSQPATQQENFKVCSNSEVPTLQKRNTFTLDSVSQFTENTRDQELPIVKALNELANKETSKPYEQEHGSNSEMPQHLKRNTFTLDSASQCLENASGQGLSVAKSLNELDGKSESKNAEDECLPSEHVQKRNTFTFDSVGKDGLPIVTVLNEMASKEEMKQNKQRSVLPDETTQKRGTFTLDSVSQSIENASEEGVHVASVLNDLASKEESKQNKQQSDDGPSALPDETSLKRRTFTLESVSQEIDSAIEKYFPHESVNIKEQDSTSAENRESLEKLSTSRVDSVSLSLQSVADESLPANEVLSQLTKQDELQPSRMLDTKEAAGKRGTFTLDSVSQTLEEAQEKGVPAVQALHQLASEEERHLPTDTPSVAMGHPNPPQNRGTYTLDTVSHAIEEAVEKGIPVSVTLNHLAQNLQHSHAQDCKDVTASELTRGFKSSDGRALSSEDEFEASFEDALEQLEDCVTCDNGEEFSTSSNCERPFSETPGKRGTYDLDDVFTSLQDGEKDSVPVVETLERLSRSGLPKDSSTKNQPSEEKRGTYTLDEVSRSLQTAAEQGIPVVEALQNLTRSKEASSESVKIEESAGKRGTYTLNEVSKSLEHAEQTGIPVIDALEALCEDKPKSPLRLKIPDRGTYTLDKVSVTLEHAKQKGLPIVDALGHLTTSKDSPVRQTPDAVHRRQGKLINRKTYALASPLETIGEGTKLRLYDGSKKQMMSPISFHVKSKEANASEPSEHDSKARGLGVVQKLDFLTSACERLLQANAKEMVRDQQFTESTLNGQTSDESVAGSGSHEARPEAYSGHPERNTYTLESVSVTIDDAKAKGIPVVETLKNVSSVAKPTATQRTNLMRLNSKSDSEILNDGSKKDTSDRNTHSLENVSRTLEDAKKAGIPVIQALDQLTNELAEFSLTAMSGNLPITQSGRDNRKRKRYSETAIKEPYPSPHGSPYPPPIRKAYSLGDVAFAVQQAFQSGTSLDDFLDGIAFEKPAEPVVSSSKDVRPRSVDSGFVSSFSDNDISSQSFESSRNRPNTYILDSSNEDLDLAKLVVPVKDLSFDGKNTMGSLNVNQDSNRRTFTLDHESELTRDIPVIEALEKLSNSIVLQTDDTNQLECKENAKNMDAGAALLSKSNSGRKKSPPKPKRQFFKKAKSPQSKSDSFVIEFFDSNAPQQATSKFQIGNDKVEQVSNSVEPEEALRKSENNFSPSSVFSIEKNSKIPFNDREISMDKHLVDADLVPTKDSDTVGLESVSSSTPTRARATWRPSGSVLDKIASLMDAAEDCGMSPADVLNQANDLRSDAEGQIEELEQDEAEDEQALTSQLAYLRMQLDEKRRHIEAEKNRALSEREDQRRRLGQTAFWYVMGKAQGGQTAGEGPRSEVLHSEKGPVMKPQSREQPRKPVAEFPDQPSPPIAWSSPANSPLPASASHPSSNDQQFETREFRLSDYPPGNELGTNQDITRPSSQPAVEVSSRPTPIPPRPSSHDPAAHHMTPARKCWNVDVGQTFTPPPMVRPDTASINMDIKQETVSPGVGSTAEIEVENHSPLKKGLAMFIGDDASPVSQGLTPEQEKKREKFMRLRQKKQEEDRSRKEAELEKKRRREEKQREKVMLQRMEEERLRQEELERQRAEQELRIREAQTARVPDSFATYRSSGPRQQVFNINDDANSYYVPGPTQPSGFAEFSGPQCYVKPSGKSNRKIIVNAISHVCLSGTVNQDQKEKCLQAISEHDGHHFMILFKDGLKFRGIYVHNLDNDQLFKVFGIGPRVVTSKMIEFLYKYNSGGKEFTKIPSKTISISVDGFAIQKSCWNTGKPVVSSKTASNLKRPPRPSQR